MNVPCQKDQRTDDKNIKKKSNYLWQNECPNRKDCMNSYKVKISHPKLENAIQLEDQI